MTELKINRFVNEALNNMIVVTGFPRGGTTIAGKIVGSFNKVEYAYEPAMMEYFNALYKFEKISPVELLKLVKSHLYHDFFINYIQGRGYNFRPEDDSSIFGMKTYAEIIGKWTQDNRIEDGLNEYNKNKPVFSLKYPNLHPLLTLLAQDLKQLRIVDVKRDMIRVVASMMAKKWFWEESLGENSAALWPFLEVKSRLMVPYLVEEKEIDLWNSINDVSRVAYICIQMAKDKLKFLEDLNKLGKSSCYYELDYEKLVQDPQREVVSLSQFLKVETGSLTPVVIHEIKPTSTRYSEEEFLKNCNATIRDEFLSLAKKA